MHRQGVQAKIHHAGAATTQMFAVSYRVVAVWHVDSEQRSHDEAGQSGSAESWGKLGVVERGRARTRSMSSNVEEESTQVGGDLDGLGRQRGISKSLLTTST